MRVFYGFDNLPRFRQPIVTVGSYDGVHAGHRVLLGKIVATAKEEGNESIVITFSPHPRTVLEGASSDIRLLNSLKEKMLLMSELGIDNLIVAPFTRDFSRVSSADFVQQYLIDRVGVGRLVVGYNHHFGHNKEGNFNYLYKLQEQFGFSIYEVSQQQVDNDKVSSTVVRKLIAEGRMSQAAKALCRPYFIICQADADGTLIIDEPTKLLPCNGTYSVETVVGERVRKNTLTINSGKASLSTTEDIEPRKEIIVNILDQSSI